MRRICMRCEIEFEGFGHNGAPLVWGRVCDLCNLEVIQERIRVWEIMMEEQNKEVKE